MEKIGRNDSCHCGSGKKYKKCCMEKDNELNIDKYSAIEIAKNDSPAYPPVIDNEHIEDIFSDDDDFYDDEDIDDDSYKPEMIPELSPEQQKIVDDWWDDFQPIYESETETEKMLDLINIFLTEHPQLFKYLYLAEEVLLEIAPEFIKNNIYHKYIELLIRIRDEQLESYKESFGYLDNYIITDLIVNKRYSEISDYLDLFKKYPDDDADNLSDLILLLSALDLKQPLFELVNAVTHSLIESENIMYGGDFSVKWFIFQHYEKYFLEENYNEKLTNLLLAELTALNLTGYEFIYEDIKQNLLSYFNGPTDFSLKSCNSNDKISDFFYYLTLNFSRYLHKQKQIGLIRARLLSDLIYDYLFYSTQKKKPKKIFNYSEELLNKYIGEKFKSFWYINGLQAVSFLFSVVYFAEYLNEKKVIDNYEVNNIKNIGIKLFDIVKKGVEITDPILRLYPEFKEL